MSEVARRKFMNVLGGPREGENKNERSRFYSADVLDLRPPQLGLLILVA